MEERIWHRHYDAGVPPSIDYRPISVPGFLRKTVHEFPDRTALIFMNRRLTYRELAVEVDRLAQGLAGLGVQPGTRVALQMPTIPQMVIAYFAALTLGAQLVPTNPLYTVRELEHQWSDSGCEIALTMDFIFEHTIAPHRDRLAPRTYVVASIPEYLRFPLNLLAPFKLRRQDPPLWARVKPGDGVHRFRDLVKRSSPDPPRPDLDLDEIAILQYTGGTTGPSKGAMLTHRNLSVNVQQTNAWFSNVEPGNEVVLTCLPLFHVFGMTVSMNCAVEYGATMVLIPNPRDLKALVHAITDHRVTIFPGVPALFNGLNHYQGIERMDVRSVKSCFSGSAPIPVDVLERFESLTGARIVEGFGMSETSPVTHCNPLGGLRKIGSVGIPVSDTDARIVDVDEGVTEVPVGTEGELIVRGPQVMRGYLNRPDETANAIREGWLYTGDLAVMDEDGYFRIVGRKKEMINCGGFKVFPDEVDSVLMAHDAVLEAATIGVPHPKRGESVKSFVVLKPGASLTPDELVEYAGENLAAYKVPRDIEFLDELPKSTVMKVLRRELLERELAKTKSE